LPASSLVRRLPVALLPQRCRAASAAESAAVGDAEDVDDDALASFCRDCFFFRKGAAVDARQPTGQMGSERTG